MVSVIVLVSRTNDAVDECLDSIENQSYDNIELIPVENTTNKLSIGAGWNDGIKKSSGDYIALVGDDDFIHTHFISELMKYRFDKERDKDYDHIYSWCRCVDEQSNFMAYLQTSSGPLFPRQSLYDIGGFNEKLRRFVDVEVLFRMKTLNMTEVRIPAYLYSKRFTSNGHTAISKEFYNALVKHRDSGEKRILKLSGNEQVELHEAEMHAEEMMKSQTTYL